MTGDSDEVSEGDAEGGDETGEDAPGRRTWERVTAPQGDYSARDVGIGVVVAAIGLAVAFGVPLALTL